MVLALSWTIGHGVSVVLDYSGHGVSIVLDYRGHSVSVVLDYSGHGVLRSPGL